MTELFFYLYTAYVEGGKSLKKKKIDEVIAEIFGTTSANISMHFSNIIQEGELDEKEVSISSKDLFKDNPNFIKKSLKKSNNRGRPHIMVYLCNWEIHPFLIVLLFFLYKKKFAP